MRSLSITNPKTGRSNTVRAWSVDPRKVINGLKDGTFRTAKDISLTLLNDSESLSAMEREMGGEDSRSNFALNVFENALDWGLGIHVLNYIRAITQRGKMPKPFQVAANRKGDIFIIGASGTVYDLSAA